MGYRVKPFTMSVRNNSTQEFVDVGLLGSDVDGEAVFQKGVSGNYFTTSNRPTVTKIGIMIFDQTLGKPIWWNGSNWVDATGTTV